MKRDLTKGIEVPYERELRSLCWTCVHSGAAKEIRCSWDAELLLVKDAKYYLRTNSDNVAVATIIDCPLYEKGHIRWGCKK